MGLSLTGPALRALRSVDLEDVCLAAGYPISRTLNCDVTGTVHNVMELPSVLGPGRPAEAGMGRPVLHEILRARAAELGATLRTGLSVRAVETNGDQISVRLDDGTTRTTDYLLGADGSAPAPASSWA